MRPIEDKEVCDGLIESLIRTAARPIVTLNHVRRDSINVVDENELKMSLGRLWRACRIYRCAVNQGKDVVYWTPDTSPAVAASGLIPEMPPETELPPEFANRVMKGTPKVEIEAALGAEDRAEYERVCANRGKLLPISATAALPMRPLSQGKYGNLRRHGVTSTVAAVMFANRDVRMSVDAVAMLCPKNTRIDVARVLSQLSTLNPTKDYFRKHGHGRNDVKYQWNEIYCYPFSSRMESDGESIDHRNAAAGVKDTQPLDHIPTGQLTETETEKEIARFFSSKYPDEAKPAEETEMESGITAGEGLKADDSPVEVVASRLPPFGSANDVVVGTLDSAEVDEDAEEELDTDDTGDDTDDESESEESDDVEESDGDEDEDDSESYSPYPKNWVPPNPVVANHTVPITAPAPTPTPSAPKTVQGENILTVPDNAFEATFDLNGQLTMVLDGTPVRLSVKQTEALICLIGPHFLAHKNKRYFRK